jgi:hypothetical protein
MVAFGIATQVAIAQLCPLQIVTAKFARNVARDLEAIAQLYRLGWRSLVLWECELKDSAEVARKVSGFWLQNPSDLQQPTHVRNQVGKCDAERPDLAAGDRGSERADREAHIIRIEQESLRCTISRSVCEKFMHIR